MHFYVLFIQFLNVIKAFLNEDEKIDHGHISASIRLVLLEEALSSELFDGFINDIIFSIILELLSWTREGSFQWTNTNTVCCLDSVFLAFLIEAWVPCYPWWFKSNILYKNKNEIWRFADWKIYVDLRFSRLATYLFYNFSNIINNYKLVKCY